MSTALHPIRAQTRAPRNAKAQSELPPRRIGPTDPRKSACTCFALIARHSFVPLWGLAGGKPLVNVLELNLALDEALAGLKAE